MIQGVQAGGFENRQTDGSPLGANENANDDSPPLIISRGLDCVRDAGVERRLRDWRHHADFHGVFGGRGKRLVSQREGWESEARQQYSR